MAAEILPNKTLLECLNTDLVGIFSPLLYRLSYRGKKMATRNGFEPSTSSVTG